MRLITFITVKILKLLFTPLALRHRVAFLSSFSDEIGENVACILKQMPNVNVVTNCKRIACGFRGSVRYAFTVMRDTYLICTSKVVVLEGNCVALAGMGKHKSTVIQLWHASGAFKMFGNDTHRKYKVSGVDYALVSANCAGGIYAGALGVSEQNVFCVGTPRTDAAANDMEKFTNDSRKKLGVSGKTVLYVPTFRGRGVNDIKNPDLDIDVLADELKGYTLVVRKHPSMKHLPLPDGVVDGSGFELMDALGAADVLITDYSSVIFEYAMFDRPMVFYAKDLGEYTRERGFYFDYADFVPGKIVTDEKSAAIAVHTDEFAEKRKEFIKTWLCCCDGNSTSRTVDFILKKLGV